MDIQPTPFVSPRTEQLRSKLLSLGSIAPALDQCQLVRGLLTAGGSSLCYGPSNCGKTFWVLDLALHIASGVPWRDRRVTAGHVVYLAAEGGSGIINRLAALKQAMPHLCDQDRFHLLPTSVDLSGKEDALAVSQILPDADIAFVVVDTLARTIGDGDENSAKDAGVFIQNVDQIREQTGAHVLIIHHSGKNIEAGARGSSALRAAVDTEIAISAERQVTTPKQRDLPQTDPMFFDLKGVDLGADRYGDPVTSAVVVEADAPMAKAKPLTGTAQVAMQALGDAIRDHGELHKGPDFPHNRKAVHKSHWRAACDTNGLTSGESESAARNAFNKSKKRLMERDLIRMFGDYVWKVHADD